MKLIIDRTYAEGKNNINWEKREGGKNEKPSNSARLLSISTSQSN